MFAKANRQAIIMRQWRSRLDVWLQATSRRGRGGRIGVPKISEKCYNFTLAQVILVTAYCVSARTVTLLLVVDWSSQVVSGAVHEYSHPIQNLNPSSPP
jgi:hypothetical protein